jgi:hypothetical protein
MIALSQDSSSRFGLAIPPSHARIVTTATTNVLTVVYEYGILSDTGTWAPNQFAAPVSVRLTSDVNTLYSIPGIAEAYANLIGAGIAPDPTDPTKSVSVPNKAAGDFKQKDIDVICAALIPELKGTVV